MKSIFGLFAFVTILGTGLLIAGIYTTTTAQFVLMPLEDFGVWDLPSKTGQAYDQPVYTPQPGLEQGEIAKDSLIPAEIQFYVNTIPVYGPMPSAFIPIYQDDMKTFSGKFGPYDFDPREFIGAKLCSYPKNFPDMLNCESVNLNYANNYVSFARGYDYDEYIGRQALKNYGAVYFIISPAYGNIAQSPNAIIKLVEHD